MKKLLAHPLLTFLCLAVFIVGCKDKKSETEKSETALAAVEKTKEVGT